MRARRAIHGSSGMRPDAPAPLGDVAGTDGGADDRLIYWRSTTFKISGRTRTPSSSRLKYAPVSTLRSYDSINSLSPRVCGGSTGCGDANAAYCRADDSVSWARGSLIPNARKYFGDIAVAGLLAQELGGWGFPSFHPSMQP